MANSFFIREYGHLVSQASQIISMPGNAAIIPSTAWEWLEKKALQHKENNLPFLSLRIYRGHRSLRVANYVGLITTPCGCQIEILPKIMGTDSDDHATTRTLLLKMISAVHKLSILEHELSDLRECNMPLSESLVTLYLNKLLELIRRGVRRGYQTLQEHSKYLRGRLLVSQQLRKRPGQDAYFAIEHKPYLLDRAENRLIKKSLDVISSYTINTTNLRLIRQFLTDFESVPASSNLELDLQAWSSDRNMGLYNEIKPWVELILFNRTPYFMLGKQLGISILFPMEKLFEEYISIRLSKKLRSGLKIKSQSSSKNLVTHRNNEWFRLKPDMLIMEKGTSISVLDAKWKFLYQSKDNGSDKYGLSQQDMYQLFAYGEKYLEGSGELFLIFPYSEYFTDHLEPFSFRANLKLYVIPYSIEDDCFHFPDQANINTCFRKPIPPR